MRSIQNINYELKLIDDKLEQAKSNFEFSNEETTLDSGEYSVILFKYNMFVKKLELRKQTIKKLLVIDNVQILEF